MSKFSIRFSAYIGVQIVFLTLLSSAVSEADITSGISTSPNLLPQASSVLNPSQQVGSFLNLISSCMNTTTPAAMLTGMISQSVGGVAAPGSMVPVCPMAAAVTLTTVCPGMDQVPDTSGISCETENPALINQYTQIMNSALCKLQCNKAKSDTANMELKCIQNLSQQWAAYMASQTAVFQNAIQLVQKQVQQFNLALADDDTKSNQVEQLLGGNQQSGAVGLIQRKQDTEAMIAKMPTDINAVTTENIQNTQVQNSLNSFIQMRKSAIAMDCTMNRPMDSYRCKPNGSPDNPPVSPKDYLICRYQQVQSIGNNGYVERNTTVQGAAQSNAQSLATLMDQITQDSASGGSSGSAIPSDPTAFSNGTSQATLISSAADIQRLYGNQLSQYSIGGTNALAFLVSVYNNCAARANSQVSSEINNPASPIGVQLYQLNMAKTKTLSEISTLMNQYKSQYSDNMTALTGQNVPLDTSACTNATTQLQLNCLNNIKTQMQGLLLGTTPNSAMNIQVKGNNPANYFNVACNGLNGCITALQSTDRNIAVNKTQITNQKVQYVLNQNQQIENYAKTLGQQASQVSSVINKQLNDLNTALAQLGGSPLQVKPLTGEPLVADPGPPQGDGVLHTPKSGLGVIAEFIQPPLPDMTDSNFLNGAGAAEQDISSKFAQVNSQMLKLSTLHNTCAQQQKQTIAQSLQQASAGAQDCYGTRYCDNDASEFQSALQPILASFSKSTAFQGNISSLSSSISQVCDNWTTAAGHIATSSKDPNMAKALKARLKSGTPVNRAGCQAYLNSLVSAKSQLDVLDQSTAQSGAIGGH